MSRCLTACLAVLIAFSAFAPAMAATTGLVRGTITVDGKPVGGASVTIEGEGSRFTTTTDAHGEYVFAQVPFGSYRVTARAKGAHELGVFVDVASDSVATVNIPLSTQLKQIASTTVTARATGAQTNAPSVNQITRATIQTSPVQNSLDKLIGTLPGVIPFSYNEPIINGFHGVTYNIDGAPLPLATTSNFAEIVDPKDIDSLEVLTGAIPAEYGGDRMGGVVNIITNRPSDSPQGFYGSLTGGLGNQAQGVGSMVASAHFGAMQTFFNANSQSTNRGLDAPTFDPIHDNSSQSDQFFRAIAQLSPRDTLSFDYSNQLAQFQIPINTNPNNPYDPIYTPAATDDVQREYDRFAHLSFTQTSRDGNGVFKITPWWRSTRNKYDGDLPNDVHGITPPFGGGDAVCIACMAPKDDAPTHNVGLLSNTYASYVGLRMSDFRATTNHAWKIGLDANRANLLASQAFACYYPDCNDKGPHDQPFFLVASPQQAQAGSQVGIYAQDKWRMSKYAELDYGIRYDSSTGYTSGWQFSPRVGLNLWDGGKNTFHAYYGRFYAAPLLEDVRQDCVLLQGCSTVPVYSLQPERDSYYETGVQHAFNPNFNASINVFRKTSVNVLDTTQLLNTPLFAVFNNAIGIDTGAEVRVQQRLRNDDEWFVTVTYSGSYAACVSGSTFLVPPDANAPNQSCVSQLAPEDHDETVASSAAYTWRFGKGRQWFATLQGNYGSGFPVAFETANVNLNGRLPAHTTFDLAAGRNITPGRAGSDRGLGLSLVVTNILNHQYPIKVANGFNTTQIANGTNVLLRLTAPF
jgi:outer membrane receptor protein involved in Fe transport